MPQEDKMNFNTEIKALLESPDTSEWLKNALTSALSRDSVDAANDAEKLLSVLDLRATAVLDAALAAVGHGEDRCTTSTPNRELSRP